ncbi:3-keto-5-aminohexanoate cleavage protein [Ferribacterium limneticum]|uniref:3-keto-5-aminohexanoate cleavage protein n=1 Tax=Ferribacterium limneticum TaxID=76259 RepID=UPI001CFBF3B0|nr:3-keto-5-aminohexanoate cleavage protein [Ferribacterium limneticum]UCV17782.1 3-keto-5-aminohexanoate cleavage protein [Ferribacterium limneticum]
MIKPLSLFEAATKEMETYRFICDASVQPCWDIPRKIAINTAVAARMENGEPSSIQHYVDAATSVIEAGACGVHIDFSGVVDAQGRRLDRDIPPVDAYTMVLEPLRKRFGNDFVVNLNVLNGATFDICVSPAREGLAEVAPCAAGHPDDFMIPAIQAMEEFGVKPEVVVHSSGEIELAKRKLIDTGILKKPYNWIILFGLPFDCGRTINSGTWVRNTQDMARHLFLMVDQVKGIDPDCHITVCAAGRASLFVTTLATMMGLHIRVGTEDSAYKFPGRDDPVGSNLEMFLMAREIAALHGREPASANEYRKMIGKPER